MPQHQQEQTAEVQSRKANWHEIDANKGFTARIILPFISTKYKTDVTTHCLLRALNSPLPEVDETAQSAASPLLPHSRNWRAPAIDRSLSLSTFFSLYEAPFERFAPSLFAHLRNHRFGLTEDSYRVSLSSPLKPISGLGFSGSLFFFTDDDNLIVKSIGRKFEYTFLYTRLLDAYGEYLLSPKSTPETLLCKMTDVVGTFAHRFGSWLGVSPSHYIVMTNLLHGLEEQGGQKWDLKPQNFFEPTRDLVPDGVKTEAARSGLADALEEGEEMVLSMEQKKQLWEILGRDLSWLEAAGTVDYSLLLGRWPRERFEGVLGSWDKGVESADGKWVYRCTIVDFLWGVEMLTAKVMRTAGMVLPEQTVTTEPARYREEFMKMMEDYVVVYDDDHRGD